MPRRAPAPWHRIGEVAERVVDRLDPGRFDVPPAHLEPVPHDRGGQPPVDARASAMQALSPAFDHLQMLEARANDPANRRHIAAIWAAIEHAGAILMAAASP